MSGWLFDNASAYARGAASPVTAAPLTMLCVFRTSSIAALQTPMLLTASGSSAQNFRFQVGTDGKVGFIAAQSSSSPATTVNALSLDTPTWVVGRAGSATDRDCVLNGDFANKGSDTNSRTPAGINRLSFGQKDDSAASNPLAGIVFYGALWNAKLDDAEVKYLCAAGNPLRVRRASLKGLWLFDMAVGSVVPDLLGVTPLTLNLGSRSAQSAVRRGMRAGSGAF